MRTSPVDQRCTLVGVILAFAAIAIGVPIVLALTVWCVVRTGDRNTPTVTYATGGHIAPSSAPVVGEGIPCGGYLPSSPLGDSRSTVRISGAVLDEEALLAALRRHLGMDQGDDGDMPYGGYPR